MATENKKVGAGVGVRLMKEGKILLGKRHSDPEKADSELHGEGSWTMPGGKLEFGESFEDAAKREVNEETGIHLNEVNVICVNNDKNEHAHFITIGLFSEDFNGDPKVMEPDEVVEWQWFGLDDLPSPLYFPSAKVIENYKKNIFYIA
jgi:ADP-ribose pyrophosphatase YjhB (NUDIX family)